MSPIEELDSSDDQNSTWIVSEVDINEPNFGVNNWSPSESNLSNWSLASRSSPLFHTACALLLASYLAPTCSRWEDFTLLQKRRLYDFIAIE